jgi:hypothetical protein
VIPLTVLIADDLHRNDHAIAAEMIGFGDAVVESALCIGSELDDAFSRALSLHSRRGCRSTGEQRRSGVEASWAGGPFCSRH